MEKGGDRNFEIQVAYYYYFTKIVVLNKIVKKNII